jgi:hypothetical protein
MSVRATGERAGDAPVARRGGALARSAPTLAVALVMLSVVFGGEIADAALPLPSLGPVAVADGVQIVAQPGWRRADGASATGAASGVWLQRGDVLVHVIAVRDAPPPPALLSQIVEATRAGSVQVVFGDPAEVARTHGGVTVQCTVVTYQATIPGVGVPVDGEVVVTEASGTAAVFDAYAPQGDLAPYAADVLAMAATLTVSP